MSLPRQNPAASIVIFCLILIPVKIAEIPGKLSVVVLIPRMVQNGEIDPPEEILQMHVVVFELLHYLVENIRHNMGVVMEGAASESPKDQDSVPVKSRSRQHPPDPAVHHRLILLLGQAFYPPGQRRRCAGHDRHNYTLVQQFALLVPDDLHIGRYNYSIRAHSSTETGVVLVIRLSIRALQRRKQGTPAAQRLFLSLSAISHSPARMHWISQIEHENILVLLAVKHVPAVLIALHCQFQSVCIFRAHAAPPGEEDLLHAVISLDLTDILRQQHDGFLHLLPAQLQCGPSSIFFVISLLQYVQCFVQHSDIFISFAHMRSSFSLPTKA